VRHITFNTFRGFVVLVLVLIPSPKASAAPQFGHPLLHVLDDTTPSVSKSMMYLTLVASPTRAGVVDLAPIVAVPTSLAPATTQSPGGDPDPNLQVVEAPSYTSISSVCVILFNRFWDIS